MKVFLVLCSIFLSNSLLSQRTSLGIEYGRAYFFYKYKDYGSGFINETKSNYNFIVGIAVARQLRNKWSVESGIKFSMYQQYFSTKRHWGAYEEPYPVLLLPINLSYQSNGKLSFVAKGGAMIGFQPEQYTGRFQSNFVDLQTMTTDSISRGTFNREYGTLFPLVNAALGINYSISRAFNAELNATYAKGLKKISDFDIYYNNGSGSNDQHARQWGYGDFASLTLAVKYKFKSKSKSD